jgi:hypothetical protein
MALDATNVRVGVTGAVYVAPSGTAIPTTVDGTLNAAFRDLGYVSEDGVTEAYDEDTAEIKAWQNGVTVRRLITSSTASLSFTLLESKANVLELFHKGSSVVTDGDTGYKINVKAPAVDRRTFVVDVVDGTDVIRIVVPDGDVTERGEVVYKNDEPIGYQVTITAYPTTQGSDENVVFVKLSEATGWSET